MPPPTNSQTPLTQYSRPAKRTSSWLSRLLLIVLLALFGAIIWQRTAIGDWLRLYGYHPSAAVVRLANQTTMTPTAEHLFYINRPAIETKSQFANNCSAQEKSIVLGCYHDRESGIYILKISDQSELNGVMQVTAAHEMLHAAYERLPDDQKATLNRELQNYYDHGLTDESIKADVDSYRSTEPGELLNEMHSIFGTEVAKLPPVLETYYSKYFANRRAVVAQAQKYEAAFRSRQSAVKRYDTKLASLKAAINSQQADLQARGAQLDRQQAELNQERAAGDYASYNRGVVAYNSSVNAYNDELAQLKTDIKTYNQIVVTRNALVSEEQELVQELSGSVPAAK